MMDTNGYVQGNPIIFHYMCIRVTYPWYILFKSAFTYLEINHSEIYFYKPMLLL